MSSMSRSPSGSQRRKATTRETLSSHPLLLGGDEKEPAAVSTPSHSDEARSDQESDTPAEETIAVAPTESAASSLRKVKLSSAQTKRTTSSSTVSTLASMNSAPVAPQTRASMQLIKDAARDLALPSDSVGIAILTRLSESPETWADLLELLTDRNASLLLPRASLTSATIVNRALIENHIIIGPDNVNLVGSVPVLTCSGIRGVLDQDLLTLVGTVPSSKPIVSEVQDATSRQSLFDTLSPLPESIETFPALSFTHQNFPLAFQDKTITVSVVMDLLDKFELEEKLQAVRNLLLDDMLKEIPSEPKEMVKGFVDKFNTDSSTNIDALAEKVQSFYEDVMTSLQNAMKANEDAEPAMEQIESCVCRELFDKIFSPASSDDGGHDEALSTRVAALNILDLVLDHLGVTIQESEKEHIQQVVKAGGQELQKLQLFRSPREKLAILVSAHKVVVDSLSRKPLNATTKAMGEGKEEPPQRVSSADLILPLLIFCVVKSNPPQLISNLRYIQRFRAQSLMKGEASYCLTNMTAVVTFLEHVDLMELGLSSEKVVTDEQPTQDKAVAIDTAKTTGSSTLQVSPSQSTITASLDATRQLPRKVSQEIVAMGDTGIKLVSGVVDTMFGRFLPAGLQHQQPRTIEEVRNVIGTAAKGLGKVPGVTGPKELVEVGSTETVEESEKTPTASTPSTLSSRFASMNPLPRLSFDKSKPTSAISNDFPSPNSRATSTSSQFFGFPSFSQPSSKSTSRTTSSAQPMIAQNSSPGSSVKGSSGAMEKFLACESADQLRISEVAELLADYKRLASLLQ